MADIKELVKGLSQDQETAYQASRSLMEIVTRASAPGGNQEEVAAALAAELNAKTPAKKDDKGKDIPPAIAYPPVVRSKICGFLAYVGGAGAVPALVEAMQELGVRDTARMALDRNPSEEAVDALIAALDQVGPLFLVGVVNSLGKRQGAKAFAAIQRAAGYDDADVRTAAVEALANFPDPAAEAIMLKVAETGGACEAKRAHAARVRLAGTLQQAGNSGAATRIYRSVMASNAPDAQKKAARLALSAST